MRAGCKAISLVQGAAEPSRALTGSGHVTSPGGIKYRENFGSDVAALPLPHVCLATKLLVYAQTAAASAAAVTGTE